MRKEAYIKAHGAGLSMPLDRFTVNLVPTEPAALLKAEDDPAEVQRWWMHDVDLAPGYRAALVAERPSCAVRLWAWEPSGQI